MMFGINDLKEVVEKLDTIINNFPDAINEFEICDDFWLLLSLEFPEKNGKIYFAEIEIPCDAKLNSIKTWKLTLGFMIEDERYDLSFSRNSINEIVEEIKKLLNGDYDDKARPAYVYSF